MGNAMGTGDYPPAGPGAPPSARKTAAGAFRDTYRSIEELQGDLRRVGLESCNLIVGVDMTKSNEWTGKLCNGGRCLHKIDPTGATQNPYERVISILGQTLEVLDDDRLVPVYGFGCSRTHDQSVFSFNDGDRPCAGFREALDRYRAVAPTVALAGPTSFAPIIRQAAATVRATGGYHILIIICDGNLTRGSDLPAGSYSPQELDTIAALQEASQVPLSIVAVGVGDGEGFDQLRAFDDRLPAVMAGRGDTWDNFQFVPFNDTMAEGRRRALAVSAPSIAASTEATFALHALMEVPEQYREVQARGLLDRARIAHVRLTPVQVLGPPSPPPPQMLPSYAHASPYAAAAMAAPPPASAPWPAPSMMPPPSHAAPQWAPAPQWPAAAVPVPAPRPTRQCPHCTFNNEVPPVPAPTDRCAVCGEALGLAYGAGGGKAGGGSSGAAWGTAAPQGWGSAPPPTPPAAPPPPSVGGGGGGAEAARLAAELARVREDRSCPVCLDKPKDTAFGCGHQACGGCAAALRACPVCRAPITARIRLYG